MGFSDRFGPVDYAKQSHGQIGALTVTIDENAIQARLGANIKARREKLGLAQTTLGERSGIHRTYINQLENGHKNLTVVVLSRLADALGTTPSALTKGILSEEHQDGVQD
jgi:DNA-binding XRE family transcriptional regulator